ncbi:class I and II aminotransferase [Vulcanisaeta souniana JCM 11219]|nr:class I and II aminotransferase [Vulcanisaeta souniana JCM 11219]
MSSNMNPLGAPRELIELIRRGVDEEHYAHYPTELGDELRMALAEYEGVNYGVTYVFNGATEALQVLIMWLRPGHIIIPIPNYSDYLRLSQLVNARIELVEYWGHDGILDTLLNRLGPNALLILSNPNSPMGYLVKRDYLLMLVEELRRCGGILIVDESFMDFVRNRESLIRDSLSYDNVFVVKSYTKFLAIPGLRVGAIYTKADIEHLVPTWPVNSIAEYAVSKYMKQANGFRESTISYIENEKARLTKVLNELGINYYDSVTHYLVIRHQPWLGEELLKLNFLIRDLSNVPPLTRGFFRVSIRSRDINDLFLNALSRVIQIKH